MIGYNAEIVNHMIHFSSIISITSLQFIGIEYLRYSIPINYFHINFLEN